MRVVPEPDVPTRTQATTWVIAVHADLPKGLQANAAACVAARLGADVPALLGDGTADRSGRWHEGLPWTGCRILAGAGSDLVAVQEEALQVGVTVVDMPRLAQTARVYDDYISGLSTAEGEAAAPVAVSLVGPRSQVDTIVARLRLLR